MSRKWIQSKYQQFKKKAQSQTQKSKVRVENKEGYQTLLSVIDRKVFDVEDATVTEQEFHLISNWALGEYNQSTLNSLSGKVIQDDPMLIVEVIESLPVYIEVNDYKAKYRVNLYHQTSEVDIQVLNPIKEPVLQYTSSAQPVITL